jgi:NADPH:quinone reductase-like Zn-dependent oxidoreductase
MKAIVYEGFGSPDILRYHDVEKPTPGEDEVLIKVHAASINPLDWKLMKGGPFLVRVPLRNLWAQADSVNVAHHSH